MCQDNGETAWHEETRSTENDAAKKPIIKVISNNRGRNYARKMLIRKVKHLRLGCLQSTRLRCRLRYR